MAKPTGHTPERPDCILCGITMFGKPFEATEGLMCGDGMGCRRRAYQKFVNSGGRMEITLAQEEFLVEIYKQYPMMVACLCDEQLDPSGALLGRVRAMCGSERKLCWSGPCYSHPAHEWTEDKPGGRTFHCPGASTDRT